MTRYQQACMPAWLTLRFAFRLALGMRASHTYALPCQTYFFTGVGDMDAYEPDCLFAGGHVIGIVIWLQPKLTSNQPEPLPCLQIHSQASMGEAGSASQSDAAIRITTLTSTCRVERFKKNVSNLGGLL